MENASRTKLIILLQISHKSGICSLSTGKCNLGVVPDVPGWYICTLFLSPIVGFYMNARPHCGAFPAFQNKMTNARGGMGTPGFN